MSYLEIDTQQGPIIVDTDRISGIGQARSESNDSPPILVLFLSANSVDLFLHSQEQADRVVDEIKKVLIQRKIRTPSKPILIKASE